MISTHGIRLDTTYFAKNWKQSNKIIYKCMNSAVGLIFNESFVEKKIVSRVYNTRDPLEKLKRDSKKNSKNMQT